VALPRVKKQHKTALPRVKKQHKTALPRVKKPSLSDKNLVALPRWRFVSDFSTLL
jgi:hypothetical protein